MLPAGVIDRVDNDLRRALSEIEDASKTLDVLRKWIVKELILIKERARQNNATTLTSDLELFVGQLKDVIKQVHDTSIRNDIIALIEKIESFIQEYRDAAIKNLYVDVKERIGSFEKSVINSLGATLLRDLEKREAHLNAIFKQLSREQI